MLFSPSAYFGGAWDLAHTTDEPLCLRLDEAPAAAGEFLGRTKGSAAGRSDGQDQRWDVALACAVQNAQDYQCLVGAAANARVLALTELPGANLQPRLTGPLLPRAQAPRGPDRPGPAVRGLWVGYPDARLRPHPSR